MFKGFGYILVGLIMVVCTFLIISHARAKTFHGLVIDADTKEPIEGAVVVAYWYKARATISGENTTLKDVKECLTDKNGKWSITGAKGRDDWPIPYLSLLIPYTREPAFIIFKPGYCSWPNGFSIESCKGKMKPGGTGEIIEGQTVELPKVSGEDRMRAQAISIPGGPGVLEKLKEFIKNDSSGFLMGDSLG